MNKLFKSFSENRETHSLFFSKKREPLGSSNEYGLSIYDDNICADSMQDNDGRLDWDEKGKFEKKIEDLKEEKEELEISLYQMREKNKKLKRKVSNLEEINFSVLQNQKDSIKRFKVINSHLREAIREQEITLQKREESFGGIIKNMERKIKKIKKFFQCPISRRMFHDPVILVETGQTYERKEIKRWLRYKNSCPNTHQILRNKKIVSNYALKSLIEEWKKEFGKSK